MSQIQDKKPLRAFFAIDLTLEIKQSIGEIIAQLQTTHKHRATRWSKPQNLHITLQFLISVKPEDIDTLLNNVRAEIATFSTFELELGALELFPTKYKPRIISMNISQQEILTELAKQIGKGILATGYEIERRPFRGHLTLARLNNISKDFALPEIKLPDLQALVVKEVVLYSSEPSRQGSYYSILGKISLKDTA
ncbi:MAG: RNA 2',3'-cyclic phosphodiesterase [Gammaproteobacteria bacterium]